ncbi:MAG: FAD binding domain-containing protein, partial [Candidatus Bathyarchaeia archaeon]
YGAKAKVLAGGTDIVPMLREQKITPGYLVDISHIKDLAYIEDDKKTLRIGSLAKLRDTEKSRKVQEKAFLLAEAAASVGSVQNRNSGSIGGNLANASPVADMAPPLIVLGASLKLQSPKGSRTVDAENFFLGPGKTALKGNELLVEIQIPNPPPRSGGAFKKITRHGTSTFAIVNAAALVTVREGKCESSRLSLGAVAPRPLRVRKTEAALKGKPLDEASVAGVCAGVAKEISPISDIRASAAYKSEVAKVMLKRAILEAARRAGG